MSYEGDIEFLCARGHYHRVDSTLPDRETCGVHGCTEPLQWHHAINLTNGCDERYPGTVAAPKTNIGWDDVPMTDHHGNKYFLQNQRFEPGDHWAKVPTAEERAAWEAEQARRWAPFAEPADKYRIYSGTTLLFTCDPEAEAEAKYEEYLVAEVADLSMYPPHIGPPHD